MKHLFSLFALLFICTGIFSQAPTIQWQKMFGGTSYEGAYSFKETSDKGFILCGSTSSFDGDVTTGHGAGDAWVVKTDSSGTLLWQKTFGGSDYDWFFDIEQTNDGGYIAIGSSFSTNGDVSGHHGGTSYSDCWVVKMDSIGTIQWQKSLGGNFDEAGTAIHQTSDSGYILCTYSSSINGDITGHHGATGSKDYWVVKLGNSGNIQWQKSYGDIGNDWAYSVQIVSGGYVVCGSSNSTGGQVTGNHGLFDYWLIKIDTAGTMLWQKTYGGTNDEDVGIIELTDDGGYVLSGHSKSNDGDVSGNHGNTDFWIVKTDSLGTIQWQKSYGGTADDNAYPITDYVHVRQCFDGGYIVGGASLSNDGDLTANNGLRDFWITKLDPAGTIEWQNNYGGGANECGFYSMLQVSNGQFVFLSGSGSNDGDVIGYHGTTSGLSDMWLVKLNALPATGIRETENPESSYVYPNPNAGQFYFMNAEDNSELEIFDLSGRMVYESVLKNKKEMVNLSDKSRGIYFYQLKQRSGGIGKGKIVIE